MTNPYKTHSLEGASGVELTIALYDGIIRFLYGAIEGVDCGDAGQRRTAVKRALDIIIHLQATLRMDIGGKPAQALSEFYAAIFALILQGSQANSRAKFLEAIGLVRNVRDAWREVARNPASIAAATSSSGVTSLPQSDLRVPPAGGESEAATVSDWTA